jgi:hypothetical protein
MILIGLDDTDTIDTPGTNQLAKVMIRELSDSWSCVRLVRHQLFFDPRVPYTSKNGSASIELLPIGDACPDDLIRRCESVMRDWYKVGSDPGLCVSKQVPTCVTEFAMKCKTSLVDQEEAYRTASAEGIFLKGLGGTNGGVIGALAAIGLAVTGDDGRVVVHGRWPDDLSGIVSAELIRQRGIEIVEEDSGQPVDDTLVDVGKHLRPNRRGGRTVLFVRRDNTEEQGLLRAIKMV